MLAHIQRDREMIQIAKYIYTDRETRMSRLLKTKHIQQTRSGMNKINHDKEWRWRRNALTLSVPTTVSFTLIRFILIEMIAILSLSVCLFLSLAVAVHVKHMCMLAIFFSRNRRRWWRRWRWRCTTHVISFCDIACVCFKNMYFQPFTKLVNKHKKWVREKESETLGRLFSRDSVLCTDLNLRNTKNAHTQHTIPWPSRSKS